VSKFGFERRHQPLASRAVYHRRLLRSSSVASGVIAISLAAGVLGYRYLGGLPSWVDALYNASMILGGMGPVTELHSDAGKIFASLYALYSGAALLTSVGVLVAPALHRMLHHFHIEAERG